MINYKADTQIDIDRINKQYFRVDKCEYFNITPQVCLAGQKTKVHISFKDDSVELVGTYLVMVVPYYDFPYISFEDYKDEIFEVQAEQGQISFEYFFESEQCYRLIVGEKNNEGLGVLLKSTIYALNDDYYHLLPLVGDFHSHTIYSDGFETPESVVNAAVRHGLNFIAITDHNNYRGSEKAALYVAAKNLPITIINGEEYSSSFTNMHIISLGAKQALDESHYCLPPMTGCTTETVVALTKQLCQKIKENGGLSVMCHPLWKPFHVDGSRIDVPMSLVKKLMEEDVFDAVEVVGGSPADDYMTSQMQATWSMGFGATPDKVAYLGSTDSHMYSTDPICGKHITLVLAKANSQEAILEAVQNKRTVALKILDDENVLFYGSPRNCMFAQFYITKIYLKNSF